MMRTKKKQKKKSIKMMRIKKMKISLEMGNLQIEVRKKKEMTKI